MTATATRRPARPGRRAPNRTVAALVVLAVVASAAVLLARWVWVLPAVRDFVARYPGTPGGATHPGTPAWVAVLHVLNLFFLTLIVRSGLMVRRSRRPAGHWTRRRTRAGGRRPATITLEQWFHVSVDMLWLACGAVFVVLLVVSGRWVRLVPTSWDVLPNAVSVALAYLSLHWPHEDSWVAYNALQMLAYFLVVFVLAPLAAVTGLRMSALWPAGGVAERVFPIERARAVHYPVLWAFGVFVVVHVTLVLSTGAARNLDHMFASRDDTSWVGAVVAAAVVALLVVSWFAVRPVALRVLAAPTGKVTR